MGLNKNITKTNASRLIKSKLNNYIIKMVNLISKQHVITNKEITVLNITNYTSKRFN